jgi:thiamine biosynthesis lipoprotein
MKPDRRQMLQMALFGAGTGVAYAGEPDASSFRRAGLAFDTRVTLTVAGLEKAEAEAALDAGFAEIRRLERIAGLSTPGSDIRKLNAEGRLDRPSPALLDMLNVAADMHRVTAGAFDVTLQPLWIFYDSQAKAGRWPTDAEAAPYRALVGQQFVRFDEEAIRFERPGMGITLNSLTHGYAADRVARVLADRGVKQAFVDTGEMETLGRNARNRDWTAAVQHPRRADAVLGTAPLTGCMATAGDYAYTWSDDFSRHHILDPRTGVSPASFATVVVIAEKAVLADALSTAISVVGPEEGARLLRHYGAEAYGVFKSGEIWASAGFPRQNLA